jgi:hypothetical protein
VADLPIDLRPQLAERLAAALDVDGKIPRALDALGPVADRDVLLLDGTDGIRARQLRELGGRVAYAGVDPSARIDAPDASADVLISLWGPFLGVDATERAEAARVLRPDGRVLIVLDYGRDDVARLRGDRPEYGRLSRRGGPLLEGGCRVRVVHCFWTFATMDDAKSFLGDAFGPTGRKMAKELKRPRLAYNVAVYHRTVEAT